MLDLIFKFGFILIHFYFDSVTNNTACVNNARIRSWNQPTLSNEITMPLAYETTGAFGGV